MADQSPIPGYSSNRVVTVSDTVVNVAGQALAVACTVAGNIAVKLSGGTTLTVPVAVGFVILPLAALSVLSTGTTATATYALLN